MRVKLCSLDKAIEMEGTNVTHTGINRSMYDNFGTIIEIPEINTNAYLQGKSFMYNGWWYNSKWCSTPEVELRNL